MLVLALALLFSGCEQVERLFGELYGVDDGPAGNGAGEGGNGLAGGEGGGGLAGGEGGGGGGNGEPAPRVWGVPVANAHELASIKAKFGVSATGTAGVTETFKELSAFIQKKGLEKDEAIAKATKGTIECVIQLGDWIDLEGGLTVAPSANLESENKTAADRGEITLGAGNGGGLRLIVVGINSFRAGKGSGNEYTGPEKGTTDHVVFHFQYLPGKHRMNPTSSNVGGYEKSEMRKYLVPGDEGSGSGNFLEGLVKSGVPKDVLWGPERYVSQAIDSDAISKLSDLLWLPTAREMFENGKGDGSVVAAEGEYEFNQTRLEYYDSSAKRKKTEPGKETGAVYWLASVMKHTSETKQFCQVKSDGSSVASFSAAFSGAFAPAFCVRGQP
jgi:hypothetical protein